jgi:predicted transposase/invertase (TIGR01784 family)
MKTDSLFYRLFRQLPELLLKLAGLEISAEGYRFCSEEIKQTAFRLDGILLPPDEDEHRPVVFAEAQFQPDGGFYPRFFSEIVLHLRQSATARPWRAVVIYPNHATEREAPLAFRSMLTLPEIRRVYLDDYTYQNGGALGLIGLIVCPQEQSGELARRLALQSELPLPFHDWLDFIETILVYKLPMLTREEIRQMIGIQDIELKQTRFYQDVFSEGQEEGMERGMKKGEKTILQKLLHRRFGLLPDDIQQSLERLDMNRLEKLSDVILDLASLTELKTWLAENA